MSQVTASQLFYWIPEASKFPNPSGVLRRIAVRLDGSVWAIPTHLVPWSLCNEMTEAGVTWYVLRFDESEAQNLAKIAHDHLAKEIRAVEARARKSLASAQADYEKPPEGKEPMTVAGFEKRVEKAVQRAKELLGDLESAAKVFEIDPDTLPVQWAAAQADLIGQAARAKARIYAGAGVKAAEVNPLDGPAIANAVKADAIPVNVVADFLLENGAEDAADSLVAAFAPEPVAVPADDDGGDYTWGDEEKLPWE